MATGVFDRSMAMTMATRVAAAAVIVVIVAAAAITAAVAAPATAPIDRPD